MSLVLAPPAPPDECREHAVPCSRCPQQTWHNTALCHRCGDWLTKIDATMVRPGDLVQSGPWWNTVEGAHLEPGAPGLVRIVYTTGQHITLFPDAAVRVAASHRPIEALAA